MKKRSDSNLPNQLLPILEIGLYICRKSDGSTFVLFRFLKRLPSVTYVEFSRFDSDCSFVLLFSSVGKPTDIAASTEDE